VDGLIQVLLALCGRRKTLYVKPFWDQFGVREKIRGNGRKRDDFNKA
jgi:hypothetical protein